MSRRRAGSCFAVLFWLVVQVISLPVTNPTTKDDTMVMKCIVEVISDTVAKPNPLPLSQECLDILRGDERIFTILRHQNLLKEFQEIAMQGVSDRTEQQKKNSGFEDELSEVLESQRNKNTARAPLESSPDEESTPAELEEEKRQQNSETDISKEDERNSLEERGPRSREVGSQDGKESAAGFKSHEMGEFAELPWDDAIDNHLHADTRDEDAAEQRHHEGQEPAETDERDDLEEEEEEEEEAHISKTSEEESKEEVDDSVRDQTDEEEENEEEDRGTSEEEHPTSSEDDQRDDDDKEAKAFENNEEPSEEEKHQSAKGEQHHTLEGTAKAEDIAHTESETIDEEASQNVEDAKRWNKMDELAKELTTTKRAQESESNDEPDLSMKLALRSHKYDFRNPEGNVKIPPKHHSKEESSEGDFPLLAMPEEKKDEEGSANRRTEDQELESLAAIEAELENVAQKLHALRRG